MLFPCGANHELQLTVVHPRTVVIERFDASVAHGTMRTSWWSVELASHTPLHAHGDAIDLDVLVQRRPKVVVAIFLRTRCKCKHIAITISLRCHCHAPEPAQPSTNAFVTTAFAICQHSPFGMEPGSMNVARKKFVMTNSATTPCTIAIE